MTPEGWATAPLGALVEQDSPITYGVVQPGPDTNDGVLFIRSGDVAAGHLRADSLRTITEAVSKQFRRTVLRGGELLIALVGQPGASVVVPARLAGANIARQVGLVRLKPGSDVRYVQYCLSSPIGRAALLHETLGSVQQVINLRDLERVLVPLPPLPEQRQIASILSSVDDAIEATQAVVDHVRIAKKAILAELLTRGLPGRHTRFRRTEIGDVPADWEVARMESLSLVITKGESPGWQGFEYQRSGVLFVTSENVRDACLELSEPKFIPRQFASKIARSQLRPGDVLVNIVGASIGRAALWHGEFPEANVNQAVAVVRPDPTKLVPRLVLDALYSPRGQAYFGTSKVDNARPNVSLANLRDFLIAVPQLEEQQAICAVGDALDLRLSTEIAYLAQLRLTRTALLSVLLTGEVRVKSDEEAA